MIQKIWERIEHQRSTFRFYFPFFFSSLSLFFSFHSIYFVFVIRDSSLGFVNAIDSNRSIEKLIRRVTRACKRTRVDSRERIYANELKESN